MIRVVIRAGKMEIPRIKGLSAAGKTEIPVQWAVVSDQWLALVGLEKALAPGLELSRYNLASRQRL